MKCRLDLDVPNDILPFFKINIELSFSLPQSNSFSKVYLLISKLKLLSSSFISLVLFFPSLSWRYFCKLSFSISNDFIFSSSLAIDAFNLLIVSSKVSLASSKSINKCFSFLTILIAMSNLYLSSTLFTLNLSEFKSNIISNISSKL